MSQEEKENPLKRHDRMLAMAKTGALDSKQKEELRAFAVDIVCKPYSTIYRAYHLLLEDDLILLLDAFDDPPAVGRDLRQVHDLCLIRRALLKRSAYGLVRVVDRKLSGGSHRWLWMDYLIPRLGLSLVLGFAVVCSVGVFYDWLGGAHGVPAAVFAAATFLLAWFLIYVHVREQVGGWFQRLTQRVHWVFFVALVWLGVQVTAAAGFTLWIGWQFHWLHAAMVAGPALVVAVLTHFFFNKTGPIGEPLH